MARRMNWARAQKQAYIARHGSVSVFDDPPLPKSLKKPGPAGRSKPKANPDQGGVPRSSGHARRRTKQTTREQTPIRLGVIDALQEEFRRIPRPERASAAGDFQARLRTLRQATWPQVWRNRFAPMLETNRPARLAAPKSKGKRPRGSTGRRKPRTGQGKRRRGGA